MTYKTILYKYKACSEDVKWYYSHLPMLIDSHLPTEVCLAYLFMRLEAGRLMTLYCGIKKKFNTDTLVTWNLLDSSDLTWNSFSKIFKNLFGEEIERTFE